MLRSTIVRAAALAIALFGAAACANDVAAPTPPVGASATRGSSAEVPGRPFGLPPTAMGAAGGESSAPGTTLASCTPGASFTVSARFGPAGGILHIGKSSLIIPGGALRDTVTISATPRGDGTSTVDFQPEGLHFRKPAGLVLDGSGCVLPDGATMDIVYLDGSGAITETIPAYYDPHWKAVAAPIQHFSAYAIAF